MTAALANGVSGDNARKVAVTDLEREFFRIQMGRPVKKISLVNVNKEKNAECGTSIVNQHQVLSNLQDVSFNII